MGFILLLCKNHLYHALWNILIRVLLPDPYFWQAREAAFRTIKTIAECLADELIAASASDSQKSYAIRKKDELERVAKTNR